MVRSRRFKPIVKLAHNSEREAAKALGEVLSQLSESRQQLQQLDSYRNEYQQRLHTTGTHGMSAQALNEYRQFIAKIDGAIEKQQQIIEQIHKKLDEKKQFWFAKRGRSKALDKVLDRYLEEERYQRERSLQKEQDDRAVKKPMF